MPELLREKRHERGKEAERNGHTVIEHSSGNVLLFISHFIFIHVLFQNWLNAFLKKRERKRQRNQERRMYTLNSE